MVLSTGRGSAHGLRDIHVVGVLKAEIYLQNFRDIFLCISIQIYSTCMLHILEKDSKGAARLRMMYINTSSCTRYKYLQDF